MRMLFTRPLNIFRSRSGDIITKDWNERDIEDRIVNAPHRFFEPGLTLVIRQPFINDLDSPWWNPRISRWAGKPDLLGVDAKGRLVIIELKATRATVAAVLQGEKYRKVLDKKSIPEIVRLIEKYSGLRGIEHFPDFASWYKTRFGRQNICLLRPFRVRIVSIGIDPTAQQRLKELRMTHVEIGGIKPGPPGVIERKRPPSLKTTTGSRDQRLSQNLAYYKCGDLFQRVRSDIDRCMSRAKARNEPTGIRWGPLALPVIGVDVFREGFGAVGVLVFKRSVSAAVRSEIDRLRKHLVWVGDTYAASMSVDTVLVVHSVKEWQAYRARFLRIARAIDASGGIGRLCRWWNGVARHPRAPAKRRVRRSGKYRPPGKA